MLSFSLGGLIYVSIKDSCLILRNHFFCSHVRKTFIFIAICDQVNVCVCTDNNLYIEVKISIMKCHSVPRGTVLFTLKI